jgi:hypothetical protein
LRRDLISRRAHRNSAQVVRIQLHKGHLQVRRWIGYRLKIVFRRAARKFPSVEL